MPRSPQKTERSGVGPERALEANTLNPLAQSAKAHPPQSLLSERRPDTAEPRPPEIPMTRSPLLIPFRAFI